MDVWMGTNSIVARLQQNVETKRVRELKEKLKKYGVGIERREGKKFETTNDKRGNNTKNMMEEKK